MKVPTPFLLLVLGCMIGCSQADRPTSDDELAPLPVGAPMPSLSVEGWINGSGPSPEALVGKVVVIDVWAYW